MCGQMLFNLPTSLETFCLYGMFSTNGGSELSYKIKIFYDREADVLYVTQGNPEHTDYVEYGEDVLLRFHPETKRLVGFTLIDFSHHFANKESGISLPFNVDFQMSDTVELFY